MFVGTWSEIDIHTEVFCNKLSCITIAHDDPLQVRFEEANDVHFELLDEVADSMLG